MYLCPQNKFKEMGLGWTTLFTFKKVMHNCGHQTVDFQLIPFTDEKSLFSFPWNVVCIFMVDDINQNQYIQLVFCV